MAPEQLAGMAVTVRSDIYSLGLVLYEIFTGKRPFEAASLAELIRARTQTSPASLTTLVRDLDPMVERVILRCIEPEPAKRPPSALAVAAALPGGDPLAAALAAGETPSPEMVAAAGEGVGLAPVIALPVFAAVIVGLVAIAILMISTGALDKIHPEYSPDVLAQKARDLISRLGYARGVDDAYGFDWHHGLVRYIEKTEKPRGRWADPLSKAPSPLFFWYRQSPSQLVAGEFHNELLTPGMVDSSDPPPELSGMVTVELDSLGRLTYFEAMPPQRQQSMKQAAAAVDWSPLFSAAGLDVAKLTTAEPLWTFLAASDTRAAWTGTWPGSSRPLRVEAAALRGKPVAFLAAGTWTNTWRMPSEGSGGLGLYYFTVAALAVLICVGAAVLARRNIVRGRGDKRAAFRFAAWMFATLFAIWLCRMHFVFSTSTIGMFLLALCTAVFYGVVMWTVYLALEPFVRSRWPQTLISSTTLLSGRAGDPVVGRDILFGILYGVAIAALSQVIDRATMSQGGWTPDLAAADTLLGGRATLGAWLAPLVQGVRSALLFFFVLFLLRVLLRNQWLAAGAWVLLFCGLFALANGNSAVGWTANLLVFAAAAIVVLRWGLLALAMGYFVANVLPIAPVTRDPSAWYFGSAVFVFASIAAIAAWAAYTAMAGRKLWKQDLFD
jgi:serine/threonine-protein kinase